MTSLQCTQCGTPVSGSAGLGLCAACSLRGALDLDEDLDETERRFGDYDLREEIGRGGMGVVYRARQRSLGRDVALKVLLGGVFAGDNGRRRFHAEAEAAARLRHPNIVSVYEAGERDGQPFYSMELVEGRTLAGRLADFSLHHGDTARPARLMAKIAAAVHAAHSQGVLHRDLKPANVLIDSAGEPRVADFGLARRMDSADGLTLSGQVLGSPAYMAPEQALGGPAGTGVAADVYSLGAILYELLTGRPPFRGGTAQAVFEQVKSIEPVPPHRLDAGVPVDLETICLKCLEKEPARRYATALALEEDLVRFVNGEPVLARPLGPISRAWRWSRRHRAAALTVLTLTSALIAIAVISGLTSLRVSRARQEAERRADESRAHLISGLISTGNRFLASDDTQGALPHFLKAWQLETDPVARRIMAARLGTTLRCSPRLMKLWAPGGRIESASFSPDGKRIVCASRGLRVHVWSADPANADEMVLDHTTPVYFAAFSPDGGSIVTADEQQVHIWNAAEGRRVVSVPHDLRWPAISMRLPPVFTGDGRLITVRETNARVHSLATGMTQTEEIKAPVRIVAMTVTPGGARAVIAGKDGTVQFYDTTTGAADGEPFKAEGEPRAVAVNTDGTRMAVVSGSDLVQVFDLNDRGAKPLTFRHGGVAYQCDFVLQDRSILTTGFDGTARLWDAAGGQWRESYSHDGGVYRGFALGPRGYIMTCGWDGTARFHVAGNPRRGFPVIRHGGPVLVAASDPTGFRVLTGSFDGTLRLYEMYRGLARAALGRLQPDPAALSKRAVWWPRPSHVVVVNPISRKRLGPSLEHGEEVHAAALADGNRLVSLTKSGITTVWDTENGTALVQSPPGLLAPQLLRTSPDGQYLLTISKIGSVEIHRTSDGGIVGQPLIFPLPVRFVAISPDSRYVAVLGQDRKISVWHTPDAVKVSGPFGAARGTAMFWWSPDSKALAAATAPRDSASMEDQAVQLWNPLTGQTMTPEMWHMDDVRTVTFSDDGRLIATGAEDNIAQVWDRATGRPAGSPLRHDHFVVALAFSPDSRLLATATGMGGLRLWQIPGGEMVGPVTYTSTPSTVLSFTPDGQSVVSFHQRSDGSVYLLHHLSAPPFSEGEMHDRITLASGFRLDDEGNLLALRAEEMIALQRAATQAR